MLIENSRFGRRDWGKDAAGSQSSEVFGWWSVYITPIDVSKPQIDQAFNHIFRRKHKEFAVRGDTIELSSVLRLSCFRQPTVLLILNYCVAVASGFFEVTFVQDCHISPAVADHPRSLQNTCRHTNA